MWPSGALHVALVVITPVCRSSDWRQPVVVPALSENGWPPSAKVSVDQVGMLARCWTASPAVAGFVGLA